MVPEKISMNQRFLSGEIDPGHTVSSECCDEHGHAGAEQAIERRVQEASAHLGVAPRGHGIVHERRQTTRQRKRMVQ